ncbi:MAG: flagellar filament capping protein FliD [Lachnospiraceae bacterium]|nr:flagellar filament capping protein FliD [Lachnospiraceae bacterium]
MAYLDISKFFGNSNNSGLGSINLSDYSMIKNGSYKKLLNSYYSKDSDTTKKADTSNNSTKKKADTTDTTGLTRMKTIADSLKASTEKLTANDLWETKDGEYDTDKIASAVKTFATGYNDVLTQSSKVDSADVIQQIGYMTSLSKTMSGALSKVGVTVDTDGKMSVDEDALKSADMKNVKELFNGSKSYASQVAQNAGAVSSAALRNQSLYSNNGTLASSLSSMYDSWV